ncbi:MAG: response regulator [Candidatus Electronema sp. V4]|uniref:response regulator n=1 Tax=Candidatus Electronema sp. V4 TaxID=3454756 RepID=UPI0040559424
MKRVLIVDDEPALLLSIKSGFEGNGRLQILTAENGREALDILDRNRLDLVVTDLRMPVMDGIQLLSVMSESFPEVPHIVMTAFGTPLLDKLLLQAGALNILEKPFDIEALEQAICKALDAHEERSHSLSGLSLSSFLQMVAMEEKTVHVKVFHPSGRNGSLFFRLGELIDAEADRLTGDAAALEMLAWEDIRVSMKEFPAPPPGTRMQSELLPLLFMAAQHEDERDADSGSPLEAARQELARLGAGEERTATAPNNILSTGGNMSIKELLKKMADEMDGVLAIQVTGMDGITLALHNPTGADVEAFSAKFAMVMKLVEKSVDSLKGLGELEENLVQAKNAWILTRFITPQYYIGIAVSREGTLGNVRLVGQRYIEQLRALLVKPE